jgi:sugar phosphate isomerase/epimerase
VLDHADQAAMTLGFEPEPGMFIDALEGFAQLDRRMCHPLLQLTIDLGHIHCMNDGDIAARLQEWRSRVVNIHIEDMVRGVHEHLMFGEGTMDFASICAALHQIGYEKGVHVELSRHSHVAADAVREARSFLHPLMFCTAQGRNRSAFQLG